MACGEPVAVAALSLLSCNCRTSHIEIVKAGAIDPLVALLHTDEPLVAVQALLCLADNNLENSIAVGMHRPVIALLVAMQR